MIYRVRLHSPETSGIRIQASLTPETSGIRIQATMHGTSRPLHAWLTHSHTLKYARSHNLSDSIPGGVIEKQYLDWECQEKTLFPQKKQFLKDEWINCKMNLTVSFTWVCVDSLCFLFFFLFFFFIKSINTNSLIFVNPVSCWSEVATTHSYISIQIQPTLYPLCSLPMSHVFCFLIVCMNLNLASMQKVYGFEKLLCVVHHC